MAKEPKQSPAYLWYPKDAFSSARIDELTAAEECWYRRALDRSWLDEGIPADAAKAAKHIGKGCTVRGAQKILGIFFVASRKDPSKVVNNRQEKERQLLRKKSLQKSRAGKLGMAKRWKQEGRGDNSVITENNIPIAIPIATLPNGNEKKREATPPEAANRRGTRLGETFLLTAEMRKWAGERRPDVDAAGETEKFCNHYRSAPGTKGVKLDWILTWKNWILSARGTNGANQLATGDRNKPNSVDRLAEYGSVLDGYPTEAELGGVP
jgi:hypothetical protein